MRLGPLVTPLPRRRWQVVAQHTATLDRLSGGRAILGLGLGHDRHGEYSTFDEPLTDDRARAERLDAELPLLLTALTGEPVAAAGGRRTTIACTQRPRCPVWVAGSAERKAGPRRAARHGLEGVALVGGGTCSPSTSPPRSPPWTARQARSTSCSWAASYPDPAALAAAGAAWLVPEAMLPGATLAEARAVAAAPPPARP